MVERISTILGGLPVIVDVAFGCHHTLDGPDYYAEVEAIYWIKRDGSKGKPIPQHIWDRAEKSDPYFCSVIENVSEMLAYEAWAKSRDAQDAAPTPPQEPEKP